MGWLQLAAALVGLAREVLRYLSSRDDGKIEKTKKLNEVKEHVKLHRTKKPHDSVK